MGQRKIEENTLNILQNCQNEQSASPMNISLSCQNSQSLDCIMLFSCVSLYFGVAGGQSLMMAKPLLSEELARRCERSEHGERQLKSAEHFTKLSK